MHSVLGETTCAIKLTSRWASKHLLRFRPLPEIAGNILTNAKQFDKLLTYHIMSSLVESDKRTVSLLDYGAGNVRSLRYEALMLQYLSIRCI